MISHNHLIEELYGEIAALKRQMQGNGQHLLSRFNLTRPQMELFYVLEGEPGLTVGELAARLCVSGGAVTQMADILAKRGLLGRHSDPADRRVSRLSLTTEGHELISRLKQAHLDHLITVFAGVPEADLRSMTQAFRTIRNTVQLNNQHSQETKHAH